MGNGRMDADQWSNYNTQHVAGKPQARVFTSRSLKAQFDPAQIKVRESRDSVHNPNSTPIILATDVTGSMGFIAHELIKTGIITLAKEIYGRNPVTDPHIMVMAVGDAKVDNAPLQCTEFEADISLADQITSLWLEGGGGGNGGESYSLPHWFAGMKTDADAFNKRGKKGYLFTIGDEPIHDGITVAEAAEFLGARLERDLTAKECLALAQRQYEVFHIVIAEDLGIGTLNEVVASWKAILPERTIILDDYTKLAEVVVSTIQIIEGANKAAVANSWSGDTAVVVANATKNLVQNNAAGTGVVNLA